jgi:purine-binding chemotaxis protein CheW
MPLANGASTLPGADDSSVDSLARQILLVVAGGGLFGIPLEGSREILEGRTCTPLPGSASSVRGLINLRGRLVTVLDLGDRIGLAGVNAGTDHNIVILEHEGKRVGLAVDEVVRIHRPHEGETVTDAGFHALRSHNPCLAGSGRVEGKLFTLLDPDSIFRPVFS